MKHRPARPATAAAPAVVGAGAGGHAASTIFLQLLLIAAVAVAAYANTFSVPFVFDDEFIIVNNPQIRALSPDAGTAGTAVFSGSRALGYLTFALNYRWGGLAVAGYHATNLAIHVVNGLLAYWVALQLALLASPPPRARWFALFAALLFVAHPLQTQAVTYIVQRFASLAALFELLSLALFLKARTLRTFPGASAAPRPARVPALLLAGSLVAALCAMMTKETAFSLPVLIVLAEFAFFSAPVRQRVLLLAPLAATMLVLPLVFLRHGAASVAALAEVAKAATENEVTRLEYLATQPGVLVTYLRLFLLPVDQNLDYDYPVSAGLATAATVLPALLLAAFAGAGVLLYRRSRRGGTPGLRVAAFGIFWFFVALSVESTVIPIRDVIFEHRMYLPIFGLILAVMSAARYAVERTPGRAPAVTTLLAVAVAVLAAATFKRNTVWQSTAGIWEDVVAKSPGKVIPHTNLGREYERLGRLDDAMREYRIAAELNRRAKAPFDQPHYNLGSASLRQGLLAEAVPELLTALELNPRNAEARNNLGNVYFRQGLIEKAAQEFQAALDLRPGFSEAHHNLGSAFLEQKRFDDAARSFAEALRAGANAPETRYGLGAAYAGMGRWAEAAAEYRKSLALRPGFAEARQMLDAALAAKDHQTSEKGPDARRTTNR